MIDEKGKAIMYDYLTKTEIIDMYEQIIDDQQKQIEMLSKQIKKLSCERLNKVSVLRCPSCYAPIGKNTTDYCEYCGSILNIGGK